VNLILAQITNSDTSIIAIGTAIAGALTSANVYQYLLSRKDYEECRADRQRLGEKIESLQTEMVKLVRGQE
jgi:prefoldin subunit 5